jgi:D-amino peptidase
VKEGLSNYVCFSLSSVAARDLIRDHAKAAMKKIAAIKPYKVEGPVTIQMERTSRNALGADVALHPEATVIDARTVVYRGKNFLDAWTQARAQ